MSASRRKRLPLIVPAAVVLLSASLLRAQELYVLDRQARTVTAVAPDSLAARMSANLADEPDRAFLSPTEAESPS